MSETNRKSEGRRRRHRRHRRGRRHIEPHRAERWVLGLQCAVVLGSLMAVGTVHVPVLAVVACAALALPVMVLAFGLETDRGRLFMPPAVVLLLLSTYSLLQAVPIPMSWLEVLSPGAADIWSRCLLPFGQPGPKLASVSADPGASMREALKWISYAAVFGSAAVLASRRGLRWAVTLVYGAAVLAALTTIAHGLVGAHRLFGLYEPQYAHLHWGVGPLLNPNNLAGYLNVGALCGFGLMLDRECPVPRWLVALGIATLVGTSVVCASRAGVGALPAGVFVFWLLTRRNRNVRRSKTARRLWWISIAAVVGGLGLAILGSSADTWHQLFDKGLEKLSMVAWAVPLVKKFPLFGIGRGASESVFAAFRQAPGHTVFTHIENFAVEWVAEWGLPVAVGALVALGWYLRPTRLGTRESVLAAGAVAASVTLLGQNFFDLGLEIPAVCIALATLLGAAYGAAREPEAAGEKAAATPLAARGRWCLPLAAPLVAVALVGTVSWGWHTDLSDRVDLHDTYGFVKGTDASSTAAFYAILHQDMLRHPAEPYFPLLGGLVAWSAQRDALPWLTRSLERDPMNGRTHLATAYVVASRGNLMQALLELRLAAADDDGLLQTVGRIATGWTHDRARLMSLLPDDGTDAATMLTAMAQNLHKPEEAELRTALLKSATTHDPDMVQPRVEWTQDLIQALRSAGSPCRGANAAAECQKQILGQIRQIATLEPTGSNAIDLRAGLLLAFGRAPEALALMSSECPKKADRRLCARWWLVAAARAGDTHAISDAVSALTSGCTSVSRCAQDSGYVGDILMQEGMPALALTSYQRAAVGDSSVSRWLRVADAASQSGAHNVALDALRRVKDAGGGSPEIDRRIADEQRRIAATIVGVDVGQ